MKQPGYVIDVSRSLGRTLQGRLPTGVDRVVLEYVRQFAAAARALVRVRGRWLVPGPEVSRTVFEFLLDPRPDVARALRWRLALHYFFGRDVPGPGWVLLNLGHSGLQDAGYGEFVRAQGWRAVYFLHDLIPLAYPEYCRPGEAALHRVRVRTMLRSGCGVLVNSKVTGQELLAFARDEGLEPPMCEVAHLAPGRLPEPVAQRPLPGPYFVMLGTIEPRKNHLLLLQIWREMVARWQGGGEVPRLVLVGQRGWECEQVLDMLDRCEALRGVVLERPGCGDAELAAWLAHSQALLFPSFAEGFGMPLVEALAMGVPVVASDLPAFREVAGDVPDYLHPLDGPGWMQAVLAYAQLGSPVRQAQLDRLARWQPPTWEAHFALVRRLLDRCLQTSGT